MGNDNGSVESARWESTPEVSFDGGKGKVRGSVPYCGVCVGGKDSAVATRGDGPE